MSEDEQLIKKVLTPYATPKFCKVAAERQVNVAAVKRDIPQIRRYLREFKEATVKHFILAKIADGPGLLVLIDKHPEPIKIQNIMFNDLVKSGRFPWLWLVAVFEHDENDKNLPKP